MAEQQSQLILQYMLDCGLVTESVGISVNIDLYGKVEIDFQRN